MNEVRKIDLDDNININQKDQKNLMDLSDKLHCLELTSSFK